MSSSRKLTPIRRLGRKAGEAQTRKSQPGSYRSAWQLDVTDPPPALRMPHYDNMDEVPGDLRQRAVEKSVWVRRFVEEGCPRGRLKRYAEAYADARGIPREKVPAYNTLRDWARLYALWGTVGLVDKVRRDAGRSRDIKGDVREIALACLVGLKSGCAQALSYLDRALPKDAQLPSYHAMWREIQRFRRRNPHLVALVREGVGGWRNRFRLALPGVEFPAGYRVALDSTACDLLVRVRDFSTRAGWKAIRCVLTVVEDVGSRALLTFNLSTCDIDSGIALGTIRRTILPGLNYPGLPTIGLPREVLVDSGPEHLATFRRALQGGGVKVVYTSGSPEDNGRIERVIDTINTEVLANLPGYIPAQKLFNLYRDPKNEDAKSLLSLRINPYKEEIALDMLLPLEELEARINAWGTLYNARGHSSLGANSLLLHDALELDELLSQRAA